MTPIILPEVQQIFNKFKANNFQVFLVGGSVRNLFLKKQVKDWDFTTDATPEQIQRLFPDSFYDNSFGTVGVPVEIKDEKHIFEITTFRSESEYKDKRHPEKVEWGNTIEEDLKRRDFTINAIALKLTKENPQTFEVIDPFNGQKDIEKKIIRAVGNPNERFKEDALRLMRAVRFATQLGFTVEDKTMQAIMQDAPLLTEIAKERIRDELIKILASNYPYEGILLLKNTGLLKYILPELLEGFDVSQVRPGRHHTSDVLTHNLLSLKYSPSHDPIVRLATLLHDVGKPRVKGADENGLVTFYNHEVIGAKMAKDITERLRLSKKDKEKIYILIRWHMFSIEDIITDAAIRRFIRRIGRDNIRDMVDLRIADRLGSGAKQDSWRFEKFRERVEQELLPPPFSVNDLVIDGNDVMKALNLKPSRRVGEILQKLFEEVEEDIEKNNKQYLIKRIKELKK